LLPRAETDLALAGDPVGIGTAGDALELHTALFHSHLELALALLPIADNRLGDCLLAPIGRLDRLQDLNADLGNADGAVIELDIGNDGHHAGNQGEGIDEHGPARAEPDTPIAAGG